MQFNRGKYQTTSQKWGTAIQDRMSQIRSLGSPKASTGRSGEPNSWQYFPTRTSYAPGTKVANYSPIISSRLSLEKTISHYDKNAESSASPVRRNAEEDKIKDPFDNVSMGNWENSPWQNRKSPDGYGVGVANNQSQKLCKDSTDAINKLNELSAARFANQISKNDQDSNSARRRKMMANGKRSSSHDPMKTRSTKSDSKRLAQKTGKHLAQNKRSQSTEENENRQFQQIRKEILSADQMNNKLGHENIGSSGSHSISSEASTIIDNRPAINAQANQPAQTTKQDHHAKAQCMNPSSCFSWLHLRIFQAVHAQPTIKATPQATPGEQHNHTNQHSQQLERVKMREDPVSDQYSDVQRNILQNNIANSSDKERNTQWPAQRSITEDLDSLSARAVANYRGLKKDSISKKPQATSSRKVIDLESEPVQC